MKLSVLDLCPILSHQTPTQSFKHMVDLARYTEELGYARYWMAEHHNMEGIGSSSPEVLISHVASHTKKIRVGSGGIMLPNHATLHIAEVFRTLEALYPGRIDLGLGRAPGTGSKTAHFLRGARGMSADDFPAQLKMLQTWFQDKHEISAVPINVSSAEVWMLGSSDFGALLAAHEGLPYAFAQHFSHMPALEVLRLYEENFRPSPFLSAPQAMLGVHIICADTDEEAMELALSSDLSFSLFVQSGKSIPLPSVTEAKAYPYTPEDWKQVRASSMPKFIGSPDTIKRALKRFTESELVSELMVLSMIYDQKARQKSYQLVHTLFS